jgi:hypothetical protein
LTPNNLYFAEEAERDSLDGGNPLEDFEQLLGEVSSQVPF